MSPLIRKIVVPVDFSEASAHAARYACALARNLGASLSLIHVLDRHSPGPIDAAEMATSKLSTLAERLDGRGLRITTEVRSGAIAQDINNAVIACGADLVVMATRRRSDLPHPLIGSVVERLIRTACCPVLVVRPSGQVRVHRQVPALQHEELVAEVCVA